MAASEHQRGVALQLLGGVIPANRSEALARIGAAYDKTLPENRKDFYLSGDVVLRSWAELSPQHIDHVLMTIVHQACGDFRTALSVVHGIKSETKYLDLDV